LIDIAEHVLVFSSTDLLCVYFQFSENDRGVIRKQRKLEKNPINGLVEAAKPTWEQVRRGEMKEVERVPLIETMLAPLLGHLREVRGVFNRLEFSDFFKP
jgi:hypothetical protein